MPYVIVRNDITKMKVDAIVCNGNRSLEKRDGVCGAVFTAAGPRLEKHCAPLSCETGAVVVTPGFDLPAKYIIHTVGPHWTGGQSGEEEILRCCYRNSLGAAAKYLARTVAVPLISAGRYGFPKEIALRIADEEIQSFLEKHPVMTVYLVVYDPKATRLSRSLQKEIEEFITNEEYQVYLADRKAALAARPGPTVPGGPNEELGPGFRETLLGFVERSGRKWPDVYNDAYISKGVASKIKTQEGYKPSKRTALAFAIALKLNLGDTERLLKSFGAALSPADRTDMIVLYFITHGKYDRMKLDWALDDYGEPPLTGG